MITEETLNEIVWRVHLVPELSGCIVGFYGNGICRVIGFPSCTTPNSENVAVIVEEVVVPGGPGATGKIVEITHAEAQQIVRNRSRLGPELIGAGISCSLTVASAFGVIGGVAGEVPTGGASTFLLVASWTGLVSGVIQCGNGLVRVGAALADLDGGSLEEWDKNQIYAATILVVDAIGVVSAVGSLPYAVRNLWAALTRLKAFNAQKLSFEVLRSMNRLQRLRVISKLFADASRTDEGAIAIAKAAREAQIGARTLQQRTSGLSVSHADTLRRIIKDETSTRIQASLRDVVGNMSGLAASASPGSMTGNASGSINWVINLLDAGEPMI